MSMAEDEYVEAICKEPVDERPMTNFEDLRRIIEPIVPVERAADGLLTLRFKDGTRLAFLCGPSGRLNAVVVQHGPETPELRLPEAP